MALQSSFNQDLLREKMLSGLVDAYYQKNLRHYTFERVEDLNLQHRGVDVIFTHLHTKKQFKIDEKAQLDYINEDLPTFAFEICYHKKGIVKKGWFYDLDKETEFYALITSIYADAPHTFTSCRITLVNRQKLLHFLEDKGIGLLYLTNELSLRHGKHGKHDLATLDPNKEGYLYISSSNKAEKPCNLILRLSFLMENGLAKRLA